MILRWYPVIMEGMAYITLKKDKVERQKGMVILPLREYHRLLELAVPTYYLKGKAAERLDKLVANGLREYREGKTIRAGSLKEALRLYARKRAR